MPGSKSELNENIATDITPKDDAFHGSVKHLAAEWWYFDAIFTNNYSIHIGCRTFSKKKFGTVMPFLEFYKDGKPVFEGKNRFRFKHFQKSKDTPLVKIFNSKIIEFDQERYKKTGEWAYKVTLKMGENAADLTYVGTIKGWKIESDAESWTVALPKAKVSGHILVNGKKIDVEGIGYHDHNWNYTLLTAINYGKAWYWGKIKSDNYNLVWANIVKSSSNSMRVGIVNQGNDKYYNINPERIKFKTDKPEKVQGKKTPTIFTVEIDDVVNNIPINVNLKMEAYEIQYGRVLMVPYWRYHVKTSGEISVDNKKEKVDNIEIMEYLRFS